MKYILIDKNRLNDEKYLAELLEQAWQEGYNEGMKSVNISYGYETIPVTPYVSSTHGITDYSTITTSSIHNSDKAISSSANRAKASLND